MKIWDISPVLDANIAVWPGDQAFMMSQSLKIKNGNNIDLGSMTTTFHVGAHADAPSHYSGDGLTMEAVELTPYFGVCQVVDVSARIQRGERILPEHVGVKIIAPRVLFKTSTFPNPNFFNRDFASFSPELIDWLALQRVLLVGIDTPSVDLFDDAELLSHQMLMKHGIRNLEGLVLADVLPGTYELIALPLKIRGADASPVRAILRELC